MVNNFHISDIKWSLSYITGIALQTINLGLQANNGIAKAVRLKQYRIWVRWVIA